MSRASLVVVVWWTLVPLVSGMYRIGEPMNHSHWTPGLVLAVTVTMVVPLICGYALGRVDARNLADDAIGVESEGRKTA